MRSKGWVQHAAIALAQPPKYHLPTLLVLSTAAMSCVLKYRDH